MKKADFKARLWTFMHYKEHGNQKALANYLDSGNLCYVISPCHNHDVDENGKKVKDHYHVILSFKGPTSFKKIRDDIIKPLGDPLYFQQIYSIDGLIPYLTHERTNKHKYDKTKILYSKNWSVQNSKQETCINIVSQLEDIIKANKITNYYGLIRQLIKDGREDLLEFAIKRAYMVDKFINSRYYSR